MIISDEVSKYEVPQNEVPNCVQQPSMRTILISHEDTLKHKFIKRDNLPTSAVVYTDGSCLNNGNRAVNRLAGVGVYWAPHHPM